MVLDHLWIDLHDWRGLAGLLLHRHPAGHVRPVSPALRAAGARALPRYRQAHSGLRAALVLFLVLAVADYLVGQLAGRGPLVRGSHSRRLGLCSRRSDPVPLRTALPAAAFTRPETRWPQAAHSGGVAVYHALRGFVLVHRAQLLYPWPTLLVDVPGNGSAGADRHGRLVDSSLLLSLESTAAVPVARPF